MDEFTLESYLRSIPRLEALRRVRNFENGLALSPEGIYSIYYDAYRDKDVAEKMRAFAELRKQGRSGS